jgi:anti-sigma regulatory factor (Ser/Thr protein kinase)
MTEHSFSSVTPVVILVGAQDTTVKAYFSDQPSDQLIVMRVSSADELEQYTMQLFPKLSAIVLDGTQGYENLKRDLGYIDPAYIEAGGPIIVLVDGEPSKEDPILDIKSIRIIDKNGGFVAFQRILFGKIDGFCQISELREEIEKRTSAIGQIVQGVFQFKTRREAQNLATMLSMTCADPVPVAIGLSELFINAVEHGCLDIGFEEKGMLLEQGKLVDEIERRQKMKSYSKLFVTVNFSRDDEHLYFVVRDPGKGFDHEFHMREHNLHDRKHGRGIVMAKGCFAELSYHGCGNEVRAVYKL